MAKRGGAVYVGVQGAVVAVDRDSGETLWETSLKGADFVAVTLQQADLFAASRGRIYRLDPSTGVILWVNELKGHGYGIVSIAGTEQTAGAAEQLHRNTRAAAAAS